MLKCWSHDGIWSRKNECFNENLLKKVKEIAHELGRRCILFQSDNVNDTYTRTLILRRKNAPGVMTITLHNKDRIYICL